MHKSNAIAQAGTAREWADIWEREALMGSAEYYNDVALYLRKAASAMDRAFRPDAVENLGLQAYKPAEPVTDTKDG